MGARTPERAAAVGALLGEGPVWDAQRQCLWFVDIKQPRVFRHEPGSRDVRHWEAPAQIGFVVPAADGSLIAGMPGALHRFVPEHGTFEPLRTLEADLPGNRLNDATCSPLGELWFGTMDDAEESDTGRIYRYAAGRIHDAGLPPACITNGPALSPDGGTLYHTDTLGRCIYASRLGIDRQPRDTRLLVQIEEGAGYPDGPAVDAEGCIWTGLFGGWAARRYSPDGWLLQEVRFPVAHVTKLAFGGADLKTAFATTARKGLGGADLLRQPSAGDLFSFRVDVAGLAMPLVA